MSPALQVALPRSTPGAKKTRPRPISRPTPRGAGASVNSARPTRPSTKPSSCARRRDAARRVIWPSNSRDRGSRQCPAACRQAETQGYRVISAKASAQWPLSARIFQGHSFQVPLFCQELLALLEAGMGLVESIAILANKAKQLEARRILTDLHRLMGEGRTFSRALEAEPGAFPSLFVGF